MTQAAPETRPQAGPRTPFQVSSLEAAPFRALCELEDEQLKARGARRVIASSKPGFPCRVSLQDAEVGEAMILFTHTHHDVDGPYRSSGPIYVRETATEATLAVNQLPPVVAGRSISARAYSATGMMRGAAVCEGEELPQHIDALFADPKVAYLHLHNALPGCFSCRVDRAVEDPEA